jgi:ubiquinone/menaquinone biosynthesis C-methylase UbiE
MLLNRIEYALMNNPLRAAIQRHLEARQLLRMGGPMRGGTALEIGCGRGVGAELILDLFGADTVHGFDLDPRMVALARRRLLPRGRRACLWVGDAAAIGAPHAIYDAVFDFGILHHVPDWRLAVAEVYRVLKPGGRFYAEEVLAPLIRRTRHLLAHPQQDRFDASGFRAVLAQTGFEAVAAQEIGRSFAWFVATRRVAA